MSRGSMVACRCGPGRYSDRNSGPAVRPAIRRGSRCAVSVPHVIHMVSPPLTVTRACLLDRSRSSTFRASNAPAREADSYSIRHKVFSRSGTSRRRHSRSIRDRDTAFVVSSTSRRRSTEAGNPGASQYYLPAHQASQEPTAARLRFQVDSAHPPHNRVRASPSSASLTPARSRSCLLYTSDAADEEDSVDLGGRRIIKKKTKKKHKKIK